MSHHNPASGRRLTTLEFKKRKGETPLVVLTAYTAPFARVLDGHVDMLLVGDSLGMALYGMETTLGVTLEMMSAHAKAVVSHSRTACVVVDMPFGSYQASKEEAFVNAARLMSESGASAVKLEGGQVMAETIAYLVERGIPVMAHVGLTPQSVHALGGFKAQGKEDAAAKRILADAIAVEKAGAFAVVLEGVYRKATAEITRKLSIPTIGIGAGPDCDGQVLVSEDMAGLTQGFKPRFVHQFGHMANALDEAAKAYADAVKERRFPADIHSFGEAA